MFVHIGMHKNKPEAEGPLLDSMRRFGEAMKQCEGLVRVFQLKDEATGHLVGLAIWETKEHWQRAMETCRSVIANDHFDDWEDEPPTGMALREV